MITFKYIERTNSTEEQILKFAKKMLRDYDKRFGKGFFSLQECVDSYIDAAIEYAQG